VWNCWIENAAFAAARASWSPLRQSQNNGPRLLPDS
jgi:hypothetical protein